MSRLLVAQRALTVPGWIKDDLSRKARAIPNLDLRFADNKSLVDAVTGASLVTFTRASSGTFVGSDRVLRTAVTNLILRSEKLDDAAQWNVIGSGATLTATTDVAAPNGAMTAWTFTSSGAAAQIQQAPTGISGATYTGSFYIRRRSGTGTVNIRVSENINTPLAGVTSEWQRFSFTATSTSTTIRLGVNLSGIADAVDLWGAQLEQSATVGEYIPTTSAINSAPRFDHNPTTGESLGLLVEEARTNLILRSEELDNAIWTKTAATVTANESTAPNGTTTADLITTAGFATFSQPYTKDTTARTYTQTSWVKSDTTAYTVTIDDGTTTNRGRCVFNIATGTLVSTNNDGVFTNTSGTITSFPNSWYRVTVTTTTSILTTLRLRNSIPTADTTARVWGFQLEEGAFPTSYIPTTTATVTRAADVASITGSNFSSWYNQTEGTVFTEGIMAPVLSRFPTEWALSDGTDINKIESYNYTGGYGATIRQSGQTNTDPILNGTPTSGTAYKKAVAIKVNDYRVAAQGQQNSSPNATFMPTVNQMQIGTSRIGASSINSTIKRLTFWPTRLVNTTLQQITQP